MYIVKLVLQGNAHSARSIPFQFENSLKRRGAEMEGAAIGRALPTKQRRRHPSPPMTDTEAFTVGCALLGIHFVSSSRALALLDANVGDRFRNFGNVIVRFSSDSNSGFQVHFFKITILLCIVLDL